MENINIYAIKLIKKTETFKKIQRFLMILKESYQPVGEFYKKKLRIIKNLGKKVQSLGHDLGKI